MSRTIIVGGVAGGASCAARLRRLDEKREILLLERGEYVSYANCGLPYYAGGVIASKKALLVQTAEAFFSRFNIEVRLRHEVTGIDRQRKTVKIWDHLNGKHYEESYDTLVLATGATPVIPQISGVSSSPRIRTLTTVRDAERAGKGPPGRGGGRRLHRD